MCYMEGGGLHSEVVLRDTYFLVFSEECVEYIEIGSLNGLFVLGRTIGFIGE